jgi:methionyl-tRNA synthetase
MTLANKGFPPAQLTNDAIVAAVKAYLRDRFNNLVNVFVGEADENVERGRKMAQAKRKMRQAMRDGDRESFREAYEAYRQQAFDPEPIDYFYDAFRDLRNRAHVRPRE